MTWEFRHVIKVSTIVGFSKPNVDGEVVNTDELTMYELLLEKIFCSLKTRLSQLEENKMSKLSCHG